MEISAKNCEKIEKFALRISQDVAKEDFPCNFLPLPSHPKPCSILHNNKEPTEFFLLPFRSLFVLFFCSILRFMAVFLFLRSCCCALKTNLILFFCWVSYCLVWFVVARFITGEIKIKN